MDLSARNAVSQEDEKVPKWREKQVKRLTVNKENCTNQISLLKIDTSFETETTSANLNNARQSKSRLNKNYEHRTLNKISY